MDDSELLSRLARLETEVGRDEAIRELLAYLERRVQGTPLSGPMNMTANDLPKVPHSKVEMLSVVQQTQPLPEIAMIPAKPHLADNPIVQNIVGLVPWEYREMVWQIVQGIGHRPKTLILTLAGATIAGAATGYIPVPAYVKSVFETKPCPVQIGPVQLQPLPEVKQ